MSATANRLALSVVALLAANCRGTLPPTEPPRVGDDVSPASRTNDAPLLGPLTADAPALTPPGAASGTGGTSVLPPPPGPPVGGGGAGGVAGSGIR